ELAQRFADFVLSTRGQVMWALPVGAEGGPTSEPLFRRPIRKDVYTHYAGQLTPGVENPYEAGTALKLDVPMRKARQGALRYLVRAAAVDNADALAKAKKKLIDTSFEPARLEEFNKLPSNVTSLEQIADVSEKLKDPTEGEKIRGAWRKFFRDKYERVAQ
ncbi:MAG: hypothetical protein ACYS5V_15720, partial [Planctomycetota bacterium]